MRTQRDHDITRSAESVRSNPGGRTPGPARRRARPRTGPLTRLPQRRPRRDLFRNSVYAVHQAAKDPGQTRTSPQRQILLAGAIPERCLRSHCGGPPAGHRGTSPRPAPRRPGPPAPTPTTTRSARVSGVMTPLPFVQAAGPRHRPRGPYQRRSPGAAGVLTPPLMVVLTPPPLGMSEYIASQTVHEVILLTSWGIHWSERRYLSHQPSATILAQNTSSDGPTMSSGLPESGGRSKWKSNY